MRHKIFAAIVISKLLLLSGCASDPSKLQKYDPQINYAATQATVVIKLNNLSYINISRLNKSGSSIANEYTIMRPPRSFIPYNYSQSIYTIQPGIYYISFLQYETDNNLYHTIDVGLGAHGKVMYGAYDIAPGSVLYLGDYECSWKNSSHINKLRVFDNLPTVKKDLNRAGYEELATKITTAHFYPAGTDVNNLTK